MIRIFRRRPDPTVALLEEHNRLLRQLIYQGKVIMADLTNLTAAVAANTAATAAVATEVANLKSSTDQTAIDNLTAQITTNNTTLNGLITQPSTATA